VVARRHRARHRRPSGPDDTFAGVGDIPAVAVLHPIADLLKAPAVRATREAV